MSRNIPSNPKSSSEEGLRKFTFRKGVEEFSIRLQEGKAQNALTILSAATELSMTNEEQQQVIQLYALLALHCAKQINSSALRCGNILPSHLELLHVISSSANGIKSHSRAANHGVAEIGAVVMDRNSKQAITLCSDFMKKGRPGITLAAELDELLEYVSAISEESRHLLRGESSKEERALKLQAAADAVGNASYCIPQFFFRPDYKKAAVLCAHAAQLLLETFPDEAGEEDLSSCAAALQKAANLARTENRSTCREELKRCAEMIQKYQG